jgi:hypothetical protein
MAGMARIKLRCKRGESGHKVEYGLLGESRTEEYTEHWQEGPLYVRFPAETSVELIRCPLCSGNVKLQISEVPPVTLPMVIGFGITALIGIGAGLWLVFVLQSLVWRILAIVGLWGFMPLLAGFLYMEYRSQATPGYKRKGTLKIVDDCGYVERTFDPPDMIRANRRHKLVESNCTEDG